MPARILAIDDDAGILRLIKNSLELAGYKVDTCSDLDSFALCDFMGYDLILLDVMMPISGLEICAYIREYVKAPILFLTAKTLEADMLEGLAVGADDYILKPFSVEALQARVHMHLRREARHHKEEAGEGLHVSKEEQCLYYAGKKITLSRREFLIVSLLAGAPQKIFSIEEIFDRVYPLEAEAQLRSISEYIYQIRNKCKPYGCNPIETLWGGGYKWQAQ